MEIKPGIYRHYKGGHYFVLGMATHSETEESFVLYADSYGRHWVRPLKMFTEDVDVDGQRQPRFAWHR